MSATGTVRIEVLGRDNYDAWQLKMRAVLIKNGEWGRRGTVKKLDPTCVENDEKAISSIVLALSDDQLVAVKNCTTSREMWLKLKSTKQSKGPARKATLLKGLMKQTMAEGSDVRDRFFGNVDKLTEMNVNLDPDQLTIQLLYSLSPSFENFRVAIESHAKGYKAANCRAKGDDKKGKGWNKPQDASMFATFEKTDTCQIAASGVENLWCLDSGCTSHLCDDATR